MPPSVRAYYGSVSWCAEALIRVGGGPRAMAIAHFHAANVGVAAAPARRRREMVEIARRPVRALLGAPRAGGKRLVYALPGTRWWDLAGPAPRGMGGRRLAAGGSLVMVIW